MAFPSTSSTASTGNFIVRFARAAGNYTAAVSYFFASLAVLGVAEMAKLELSMLLLLSAFLVPLLMVLAARLFARLEQRPLVGFVPALLVLFLPVTALAQATAPASSPAPSVFLQLVLQYLPWVVGILLTAFVAVQTGIVGWLQSKRDAADSSAATKALCSGALILDHLAADFAGKLAAELKANPALKAADLLPAAATAAKATLSADGADALQEALGVAAGGLEARIGAAVAAKLGGAETHAAALAGAQAAAAVKAMPLDQLAAKLAAGPAKV